MPALPARPSGHAGRTGRKTVPPSAERRETNAASDMSMVTEMAGQGGLLHDCHKPFSRERPQPALTEAGHPPLCKLEEMCRIWFRLQRPPEIMRDLADYAAAERQHANHKDHALDHRHPLPEAGEVLLHGDDHERADHRAEHGAEPANQ